MAKTKPSVVTRRQFVKTAAVGAAVIAAPAIVTAAKTDSQIILGDGDYRYEVHHDWPQLPSQFTWQTTHDVAVDRDGFVYILHQGKPELTDHPSIFVFDRDRQYVRSFGSMFQGGGHGLEIRDEAGQQFLYVSAYVHRKLIAKLDLKGEVVWVKHAPMASGHYKDGEDGAADGRRGLDSFLPTNFAFLPDGNFLVADGYGSFYIHRYDPDGNWLDCFGGPGDADAQLNNPHGISLDDRPGREPRVVIADRMHHQLKWFTLDGQFVEKLDGFLRPCNISVRGDALLVPDLDARVTLLDKNNQIIAHLANDDVWREAVNHEQLRTKPDRWQAGKFVHPHDACFDADGNILVPEWVVPGRVSLLRRLA